MNTLFKTIARDLPHSVVYYGYKAFHTKKFKSLQNLRTREADKNGYSLRGFDDLNCIFIHIPKTGGVSLSASLFGNLGGGHRTYFSYYPIFSPTEFNRYFKFALVRNPWDRMVSAYFFLKKGGLLKADQQWFEKNLSSFENFEEFVCKWVNKKNIYSYLHFIPQHYYIAHRDRIMIDKVYKFEEISSAINDINSKLDLDITLPHRNKTENRESDYRQYYNSQTKKIIEDVYQKDIHLFDYSF